MVSAKNLAAAIQESEARKLPLLIAFDIPDDKIPNEVRKLTGAKGKVVFLPIGKDHPDRCQARRRFAQSAEGFVVADEFANPLKSNLTAASEVLEAIGGLDELTAALAAQWTAAIKEAKPLLASNRFPEAAKVLQGFAFAAGSEKAREGKRLYDEVASRANEEYQTLIKTMPFGKHTEAADKEWKTKLAEFTGKWPRTPAAFAAEDLSLNRGK